MPNKWIDKPVLVAVEGLDCLHLLLNSPLRHEEPFRRGVLLWDFTQGGIDLAQFLKTLRSQRNFQNVRAIGIIRDAEYDARAMEESVRHHLQANEMKPADRPGVLSTGSPAVGYLLVPDGQPNGCLEHACLAAVTNPRLLDCSEKFFECVGGRALNANWQAKLKVHTAIAGSGHNPAMTLGQSAGTGLWSFDHPALRIMLDFVRSFYTFCNGGVTHA